MKRPRPVVTELLEDVLAKFVGENNRSYCSLAAGFLVAKHQDELSAIVGDLTDLTRVLEDENAGPALSFALKILLQRQKLPLLYERVLESFLAGVETADKKRAEQPARPDRDTPKKPATCTTARDLNTYATQHMRSSSFLKRFIAALRQDQSAEKYQLNVVNSLIASGQLPDPEQPVFPDSGSPMIVSAQEVNGAQPDFCKPVAGTPGTAATAATAPSSPATALPAQAPAESPASGPNRGSYLEHLGLRLLRKEAACSPVAVPVVSDVYNPVDFDEEMSSADFCRESKNQYVFGLVRGDSNHVIMRLPWNRPNTASVKLTLKYTAQVRSLVDYMPRNGEDLRKFSGCPTRDIASFFRPIHES